jgi:uncharacterized membrane protein YjjP (DUF1212 family)
MATLLPSAAPGVRPDPLEAAATALVRFGALMLRAGNVSFRAREGIERLSASMALDHTVSILSFDYIAVTAHEAGRSFTAERRVTGFAINADRIDALDRLAREAPCGTAAADIEARLDALERAPALRTIEIVSAAVAVACAAFAFLNGGGPIAMLAAGISGGIGQVLRTLLLGRRLNQFVVTALCAVIASTSYCSIIFGLLALGVSAPTHAAGFISSVLFLVPGFPLVAAFTDLAQGDLTVGVTRFAYCSMLVLAAGFGICIVSGAFGLSAAPPPPWPLGESTALLLRAVATTIGACGFAMLYNSPRRAVLTVGILALLGNDLRLGLHDAGMALPAATFLGALAVGLLASIGPVRAHGARIAVTVPGIILMVPGTPLYTALIGFGQGDIGDALTPLVTAAFIIGAMTVGLLTARLLTDRAWLYDR